MLIAQARTSFHDERRAVIDVDVTAEARTVAMFRGTARARAHATERRGPVILRTGPAAT